MPSSDGANNRSRPGPGAETRGLRGESAARGASGEAAGRRAIHARVLGALVAALALIGLGDSAFGGEAGALAAIARCPAAARLLAEATPSSVVAEGAGFALAARATSRPGSGSGSGSGQRARVVERRVTARFPRDAAGRIEIGVAGEARRVGVRRASAFAAPGSLAPGALVFAGAARGIDAIWLARGPDAEELLVVREGAAAIAYDLDLPSGSTLVAPPGFPGLVEVRDAEGEAWMRLSADAAWDAHGRAVPIAVRVTGARVWIDVPADAARPVVVDPLWSGAGRMAFGRSGHTATLLGTGRVLLAGGRKDDPTKGATAEIYDPTTGRFTAAETTMQAARAEHTATLLQTGDVLLDGGLGGVSTPVVTEVFVPATSSFYKLSRLLPELLAREQHTGTLLADGHVLLAGGVKSSNRAVLYEPASIAFTDLLPGSLGARLRHTATPLADGRVLLVGGDLSPSTTEVFALADLDHDGKNETGTFAPGRDLLAPHKGHTATLLREGRVLIAGGGTASSKTPGADSTDAAELFDPTGALASVPLQMQAARGLHTATLLPSGRVLLVGGAGPAGTSAEVFDPADRSFALTPLATPRYGGHTATLLPSGAVLIAGGLADAPGLTTTPDVEIFDPHADRYPPTKMGLLRLRGHHSATRLLSGQVLLVGGTVGVGAPKASYAAELYDREEDRFLDATAFDDEDLDALLNRDDHTATLLPSGEVLIAGGTDVQGPDVPLATTLLYDPEARTFQRERPMIVARTRHTATTLPSGEVLITGGLDASKGATSRCEIYAPRRIAGFDPLRGRILRAAEATFRPTTSRMTTPRVDHSATLLPSGKVLIVGGTATTSGTEVIDGSTTADDLGTAELYDPVTGQFQATGSLVGMRPPVGPSTATLLPSGEVLIIGRGTPEIYDPASGEFRVNVDATAQVVTPERRNHTATLLPSGRVLIAGGEIENPKDFVSPVLYSPATGEMSKADVDESSRYLATATLLATGEVLIAGGHKSQGVKLTLSRRWIEAPDAAFQPRITSAPARVPADRPVRIEGDWGGLGPDSGGGTSGSSASSDPVAIWMPSTGGALVGRVSAWTPGSATWTAPDRGLAGSGLLFVSVGGSISAGAPIRVLPGPVCTSTLDCDSGHVCSAEGRCVDPVETGLPGSGCAIGGAPAPRGTPAAGALLLGLALAALRRGARAATRARCRAGRCSRRRRARRAPARRRA